MSIAKLGKFPARCTESRAAIAVLLELVERVRSQISTPDMSKLRFVISKRREELMLTQEELSAISGVSRQSILDIGSGKSKGSIETWLRLAKGLDISLDELTRPVWGETEEGYEKVEG